MSERKIWPDDYMSDKTKTTGIGCPKCGCKRAKVTNSIPFRGGTRQRRRVCANCGRVYHTYERV